MIRHITTVSGSVVQVTTFNDGSLELDVVTSLSPVAAHGSVRFTAAEAVGFLDALQEALSNIPDGWREVEA